MRFFNSVFLVFLLLIIPALSFAQGLSESIENDKILGQLINRVDSLALQDADKNVYPEAVSNSSVEAVYQILEILSYETSSNYGPLLDEVRAERDAASDDIGLRFRTGYRENIEEGLFSDGDIYYQRRFNVGLQWDILDNGLFESNQRFDELEVREKMVRRDINQLQANERYDRLFNRLIYLFNLQKINVIQQYLPLVNANLELMQRLHYLDYEPWERVLEFSEMKARLQSDLNSYRKYNQLFRQSTPDSLIQKIEEFDTKQLPLIDFDIDAYAAANDSSFSRQALTSDDLEKLNYSILSDISLGAYVDYNIYDGIGNGLDPDNIGGREYFSVGVNLSIPLPVNASEKRSMVESRKARYKQTQISEQFSEQKEIYNIYYEFKYKTQQFIHAYRNFYSRESTIRDYKVLGALQRSELSTQRLMHTLMQRYSIVLELIDLKQQMYLQLINMDKYVDEYPIFDFATTLKMSELFPEQSVSNTGVYLWSETFAAVDNQFLEFFLESSGVNKVFLSLGSDYTSLEKERDFIESATESGIEIHLLFGGNEIIQIGEQAQRDRLKQLNDIAQQIGVAGIHLDVEPHTFADWDGNRSGYESDFLELLENASQIFSEDQLILSVSIPHFYDSIAPQIEPYIDNVVVMIYETDNIDLIRERVEYEASVFGEKMNIAIRPEDYPNFEILNRTILELLETTDATQVILHDAGELMNIQDESR